MQVISPEIIQDAGDDVSLSVQRQCPRNGTRWLKEKVNSGRYCPDCAPNITLPIINSYVVLDLANVLIVSSAGKVLREPPVLCDKSFIIYNAIYLIIYNAWTVSQTWETSEREVTTTMK